MSDTNANDHMNEEPQVQAYAMEYKPTLSERFWHRLGFKRAAVPFEDYEDHQGRLVINTDTKWGFSDRIRILISGRTHHYVSCVTEPPVTTANSTVAVSVLAPELSSGNSEKRHLITVVLFTLIVVAVLFALSFWLVLGGR